MLESMIQEDNGLKPHFTNEKSFAPLTHVDILRYLKDRDSGGMSMKGKVRTREKCPKCGQGFKEIPETDLFCPNCNTRPKSFYIVLFHLKKTYKISRDLDGHTLDSYKRAHRLLERIRKDIDDHKFDIKDYVTKEIEQFKVQNLFSKWIKTKSSKCLSPAHIAVTKRYLRTYYLPFFQNLSARDIRTYHINDFLDSLPINLAVKTKKNILTMLKNFCNWLNQNEYIARMPIFPVLSPPETVIHWIDKETQLNIINNISENLSPIFTFMAYHPVRPSEAIALKVKDFDVNNKIVHICRTLSLKEERTRKNKKSYYLPLADSFDFEILKNKLPEAYIFTSSINQPYTIRRLEKIWHNAREKAGVPHITMYSGTRHSIASQAVNRRIDLSIVSQALGHSSLEMTKKYASLNVQMLDSVTNPTAQLLHINEIKNDK
ncbi:MAG: tyrosine-type recombinase/integrase [Nitrospirae bacterium]|nr:tyrosine-type recombinase/integrase [Nitrospirota bacterium]